MYLYIQAQADQQAGPLRQKIEEKRQQRAAAAAGAAVTPTASVAAPSLPPPVDDKRSGGEERKEGVGEPGRRQWGDPVAMPTLVRRPSVTAVVTEGKDPIFKLSPIFPLTAFSNGEHSPSSFNQIIYKYRVKGALLLLTIVFYRGDIHSVKRGI